MAPSPGRGSPTQQPLLHVGQSIRRICAWLSPRHTVLGCQPSLSAHVQSYHSFSCLSFSDFTLPFHPCYCLHFTVFPSLRAIVCRWSSGVENLCSLFTISLKANKKGCFMMRRWHFASEQKGKARKLLISSMSGDGVLRHGRYRCSDRIATRYIILSATIPLKERKPYVGSLDE